MKAYKKYPLNLAEVLLKDNADIVYLKGLIDVISQFSEREQTIIRSRFLEHKTLREIGMDLGLTGQRIRQIEAKTLRKLISPQCIRQYTGISLAEHFRILQEKEIEMAAKYTEIIEAVKAEKYGVDREIIPLYETDIEALNLSIRAFNCLKRGCINTIGDIAKMTIQDLFKVRNLGRKSVEEITAKMIEVGIILEGKK